MLFGSSLAQGLQQCWLGGKKEGGLVVIPALCLVRSDTVSVQNSSGGLFVRPFQWRIVR
jgi:hypothetical protein